ncbi:MAG: hypothetical protein ABEJ26_01270 [Halosimplex sp.]
MNVEVDDLFDERPVVATVVVALVATVVYVAIQLVSAGGVALAETGTFVLVFTLVYVGGSRYLRGSGDEANGSDGDAP